MVHKNNSNNVKAVYFHVRYDAETKSGGDVNLMKSYADLLSEFGDFEVEVSNTPSKALDQYCMVFAANLDRPFESTALLYECIKLDTPFALYCLHHPYRGIRSYLKFGSRGTRKAVAFFSLFDPNRYESLLWLIKVLVLNFKLGFSLPLLNIRKAQKALIEKSSALMVTSNAEKKEIEFDIGKIKAPTYFVPHLTPSVEHNDHKYDEIDSKFSLKILVPGRLESRKNQYKILSLVDVFPSWEFVIIGDVSPTEIDYGRTILDELVEKPNVRHIPHLPEKEFMCLLNTSDIILCVSWFEVTSIIELLAASLNKQLVATQYSYLDEFYPDYIQIDPSSVNSIEKGLITASERLLQKFDNTFRYPSKTEIFKSFEQVIEKNLHIR